MNNPNIQLKDLIYVEHGIIPPKVCDHIVDEIENKEWIPHVWYNNASGTTFGSEEKMELDIQSSTPEQQNILNPFIIKAGFIYNTKYRYESKRTMNIIHKFSSVRFNRYSPGQIMRKHHDHIHSLFDGNDRGIPVLSFILNLNDGYEGADLFFWDDYIIPLGKGDIIMFPSLFLFPHGVTESKRGKRYSAVSWSW